MTGVLVSPRNPCLPSLPLTLLSSETQLDSDTLMMSPDPALVTQVPELIRCLLRALVTNKARRTRQCFML